LTFYTSKLTTEIKQNLMTEPDDTLAAKIVQNLRSTEYSQDCRSILFVSVRFSHVKFVELSI